MSRSQGKCSNASNRATMATTSGTIFCMKVPHSVPIPPPNYEECVVAAQRGQFPFFKLILMQILRKKLVKFFMGGSK
jgi:hypothetical protein